LAASRQVAGIKILTTTDRKMFLSKFRRIRVRETVGYHAPHRISSHC